MTEQSARPVRRPVAPFARQDAIYFLASAGAFLGRAGAAPEYAVHSAGHVCEALIALGVSEAELRIATARGLMGEQSRWGDILTQEFMDRLGEPTP